MKKILSKNAVIIGLTFLIPGIIAFITKDSFKMYNSLVRPKLSPPGVIFPIVWNILYLLMSVAVIMVKNNNEDNLKIYYIQLVLNALWTPIFFLFKLYYLALIELIVLLVIVIYMTYKFSQNNKSTLYLLVPYIAWLLFALYLNLFIAIYN